MTMSVSSIRSPRPTSAGTYQSSSPRLPSPLNPSPNSEFSPPAGHTPRNSPIGEISDTLSPLREHLDSGLTSPWPPPGISRTRTASFSRSPRSGTSPERSPVMVSTPLQSHRAYGRHTSPSSSPFAQEMPFPTSPLSSSPLAGPSRSPISYSPRPLSPSSNGLRQGQSSPASIHNVRCSPLDRACMLPDFSMKHSPVLNFNPVFSVHHITPLNPTSTLLKAPQFK